MPLDDLCPTALDNPAYYINREMSWLQFNARVLEEVLAPVHPLLERVRFLAIDSWRFLPTISMNFS